MTFHCLAHGEVPADQWAAHEDTCILNNQLEQALRPKTVLVPAPSPTPPPIDLDELP